MTRADRGLCFGVSAVLLLRLQARVGEWVAVNDLAAHFRLSADTVRLHLEDLAACGDVTLQIDDGVIVGTRIPVCGGEPRVCA